MAERNNKHSNEDRLTWKDSWLQDSVELGLTGAILGGAGYLGARGNLSETAKNSRQAVKAGAGAVDNYMRRRAPKGMQFGWRVGKRSFDNLKRMDRKDIQTADDTIDQIVRAPRRAQAHVDSEAVDERLLDRAYQEVERVRGKDLARNKLHGKLPDNDYDKLLNDQYEKFRGEEFQRSLAAGGKDPGPPGRQNRQDYSYAGKDQRGKGKGKGKQGWLPSKKDLAETAAGSGVAGAAFGVGITGAHALDRTLGNKENQKQVEDALSMAGSYFDNKKEEKTAMDKEAANVRGLYNQSRKLGKKFPEAVISGAGFTGVSLAAAHALNKDKDKEGEGSGNQVVINLGEDDPSTTNENQGLARPPSHTNLPKLSSVLQDRYMEKQAGPGQALKQYAKNLGGRSKELNRLRTRNHEGLAARALKNKDVDSLAQKQYGNLTSGGNLNHYKNKLMDNKVQQSKNLTNKRIEGIEEGVARAQMGTAAGAVGVGGGGVAALAAQKSKNKKEEQANGTGISRRPDTHGT